MIYRLVSTSPKRVVESPFCLSGERIAAFYLEETALKIARALRESKWKTVYGCYAQPDGTFLIGLASARAAGSGRRYPCEECPASSPRPFPFGRT